MITKHGRKVDIKKAIIGIEVLRRKIARRGITLSEIQQMKKEGRH